MGYVTVKTHTDSQLSLLREPSFFSKAVFVGFFVGVFGIFVFGSESLFFKAVIGIAAACLSCLIVDNYEMCEFDKAKSEVKITRLHWFQFILAHFNLLSAQPYVTADLRAITDVRVAEEDTGAGSAGGAGGKAYQVVLCLDSGVTLGVTEVFTTDNISVHEKAARTIRTFLGQLPPLRSDEEADDEGEEENVKDGPMKEEISSEEDDDDDDDDDDDIEDDFEQISRADLEGMEEDGDGAGSQVVATNLAPAAAAAALEGAGDAEESPEKTTQEGEKAAAHAVVS